MTKNIPKKRNKLQAFPQMEDIEESPLNIKESEFEENSSSGDTLPYLEAHAHLIEEFRWLNRLLAAHVLRLRHVNFYESVKDFRGFFIADEEIDALIAEGIFESNDKVSSDQRKKQINQLLEQAREIRQQIAQRIQITLKNGKILPLAHLANSFQLSEFEYQALITCIAPQIDARYEKLYAYIQNDFTKKTPSVDLIFNLLCHDNSSRLIFLKYFHPDEKLRHYGLIESLQENTAASSSQYSMRADPRIVYYALGNNMVDHRLIAEIDFFPPFKWVQVVVDLKLQDRLQKVFNNAINDHTRERQVFYFYGRHGTGKKSIARALCGEIGMPLALVDVRTLLKTPEIFGAKVRLILREGLLQSSAIYFDHIEKLEIANEENPTLFTELIKEINDLGWLTFLGSERPLPSMLLDLSSIYPVEIPAPDYAAQKKIWKIHRNGACTEKEKKIIDLVTGHFDLTGGQIVRSIHLAKIVSGSENGQVTPADLMESCRKQSQAELTGLAKKIRPVYTWNDIVLPDDTTVQLREVCQRVTHRHRVLGEWGFDRKFSQGKGVSALFAGPSGTGKTMAAEIIANELGLDLFKIDLSGVVSKYIGETEKNLDRIFTVTEYTNAILFFDEADALFGKRSEVRDSHDRYANIEISYLLQKMEQYEGITILATNLRQNLDESFVRRLAFIIHFPFPDEVSRQRIWKGIWPENITLSDDLDFEFLGNQFKLNGGNIKNIALSASFLAANDGEIVAMEHLFHAMRREYQKMGKTLSMTDLKPYYELNQNNKMEN